MTDHIGYLYYKEYFDGLSFEINGNKATAKMDAANISRTLFSKELKVTNETFLDKLPCKFKLKTVYPGLLVGSGYVHEIGGTENELKLGCYFDATSGLPFIPASSVKGTLRHPFEQVNGDYIKELLKEIAENGKTGIKEMAREFIDQQSHDLSPSIQFEREKVSRFVAEVFHGKKSDTEYLPLYERDIFYDASPINSERDDNHFLGNDYITPHNNPLGDPNPIQFMKVLPEVVFRFHFKLTDNVMKADLKKELFRQIIIELGIGAKTNVGYGQWTDKVKRHQPNIPASKIRNYENYQKDKPYQAIVEDQGGEYLIFRLNRQEFLVKAKSAIENKNKKELVKKKNVGKKIKALNDGDTVTIIVRDILKPTFSVKTYFEE